MSVRSWVPRWWRGETGRLGRVADLLLAPAELAYRGVVAARDRGYAAGLLRSTRAAIPVLRVRNVSVGGAGKTPVAAWIAARLLAWGHRPAVALRGYGADEVLVHRELNPGVPVFAAARRVDAVRQAVAAGCDCVVLDDGFQHRALARDLDLVLLPAEEWSPRPRLLPRGPWREPPRALRRADLVLVTRKTASAAERDAVLSDAAAAGATLTAACRLEPTRLRPLHPGRRTRALGTLRGKPLLAVAALATPAPFVRQLEQAGGQVEAMLFTDHHPYGAEDADRIRAAAAGRMLVMTLKDAVKLRGLLGPDLDAWVLHQTVTVEQGEDLIDAALRRALETGRA